MIEQLIKDNPNDADLGKAVREYFSKPEMIEQECINCGSKFKGTEKIDFCPSCYV
jgi:rubrerythrin